uniref:Uncharacterized protein n=1 Tax=Neovison vison TaxID=452646 RepID=A0A8C7C5J0_NEOVI
GLTPTKGCNGGPSLHGSDLPLRNIHTRRLPEHLGSVSSSDAGATDHGFKALWPRHCLPNAHCLHFIPPSCSPIPKLLIHNYF